MLFCNPNLVAPLTWSKKISYSLIAIIDSGPLIVGFYLTPYLLEVAQLTPQYTGIVFLIGQLTDGVYFFPSHIVPKIFSNNCTSDWKIIR